MSLVQISAPGQSPLPCAVHLGDGACREVTIRLPIGQVQVLLCLECYAQARRSGTFRKYEILGYQEFVVIDTASPAYRDWLTTLRD